MNSSYLQRFGLMVVWATTLNSCSLTPDAGDGGPITKSLDLVTSCDSNFSREEEIKILEKAIQSSSGLIDERNYRGVTPLYLVLSYGDDSFTKAKLLLDAGADPLALYKAKMPPTPLHFAARENSLHLVKLMLSYIPPEKDDKILADEVIGANLIDWTPEKSSVRSWLAERGYKSKR